MKYMYVGIFAALGGSLRYSIALLLPGVMSTLIVNIIGAFILGYCVVKFKKTALSDDLKTGITGGFCGSFTTFSTFSKDAVLLLQHQIGIGMLYIIITMLLGISAAFLGMRLGVRIK